MRWPGVVAIGAVVGAVAAAMSVVAVPVPSAPAVSPAPVVVAAGDQGALVQSEDDRLARLIGDALGHRAPYLAPAAGRGLPTEVLTARAAPYDLAALANLGAAARMPGGAWLLTRSVFVGRGARLAVAAPGTTLRITSGAGGFASVVAFEGGLALSGAPGAPLTVTSWDPATSAPDRAVGDGRAYVRAFGARMDLTQVQMSDLGFWSGRTGGLAWTGSASTSATGSASVASVEHDHYGLYCSRASGLTLDRVALYGNELDGLVVRRGSKAMTVRSMTTSANGGDGIAVEDGAAQITVDRTSSSGNTGAGIRVDGTPATEGAMGPNGSGFVVTASTITGNRAEGIHAIRADGLAVRDSTLSRNGDGIALDGPARDPEISGTTIDTPGVAIAVRGGATGTVIRENRVGAARIGVLVRDSTALVARNTVTASRFGVLLVGAVHTTTVTGNTISGAGPAALGLSRLAPGAVPVVTGNDDSGWSPEYLTIATRYVEEHPLILLWTLILAVPLGFRLRRRRHDPVVEAPLTQLLPTVEGPESTHKLPVTKVTVVSGLGAAVQKTVTRV